MSPVTGEVEDFSAAPDSATTNGGVADSNGAGPDAPLRGIRVLAGENFSFMDAIGGVRGMIESTLPGLVFVVAFLITHALTVPLVAASGVAVLAVVVRLVQRTPMTQAFAGLLGVGIGVLWARWTGQAANYFAGGLVLNAAWAVGILVSLAAKWPVVGVVVSLLRSEDMGWRTDPELDHMRRRYVWASWLWLAMFGLRLAVQMPLYLQKTDEAVGWLGTARLVMGVPLFALTLWVTWMLVGSQGARSDHPDRHPIPQR